MTAGLLSVSKGGIHLAKKTKKAAPQSRETAGIKSFLDMIAPSVVKFEPDHFICGNTFRCVWALREYPTQTDEQAILRHLGEKDGITVVDALAELPEVSECYEVWNQIHEELNECYGHSTPWERLPLSQRKEFRKIKNDIIREAESIRLGLPTFEDEGMQDDPEPESQKEEHQSYRRAGRAESRAAALRRANYPVL